MLQNVLEVFLVTFALVSGIRLGFHGADIKPLITVNNGGPTVSHSTFSAPETQPGLVFKNTITEDKRER